MIVAEDEQPDSVVQKRPQSPSAARCVHVLCQRSSSSGALATRASHGTLEVNGICDLLTAHEESSLRCPLPLARGGQNLLTFCHVLILVINRHVPDRLTILKTLFQFSLLQCFPVFVQQQAFRIGPSAADGARVNRSCGPHRASWQGNCIVGSIHSGVNRNLGLLREGLICLHLTTEAN